MDKKDPMAIWVEIVMNNILRISPAVLRESGIYID